MALVTMNHVPFVGSFFCFLLPTFYMLIYSMMEHPWEDWMINKTNSMNEMFLYIYGIFMVLFTGIVEHGVREGLGILFLLIFQIHVIHNIVILLRYSSISTKRAMKWWLQQKQLKYKQERGQQKRHRQPLLRNRENKDEEDDSLPAPLRNRFFGWRHIKHMPKKPKDSERKRRRERLYRGKNEPSIIDFFTNLINSNENLKQRIINEKLQKEHLAKGDELTKKALEKS